MKRCTSSMHNEKRLNPFVLTVTSILIYSLQHFQTTEVDPKFFTDRHIFALQVSNNTHVSKYMKSLVSDQFTAD